MFQLDVFRKMPHKYKICKGEDYDYFKLSDPSLKNSLDLAFTMTYDSLSDIVKSLPSTCVVPAERLVRIEKLPYTIKEWPIIYGSNWYNRGVVAKIIVIEK